MLAMVKALLEESPLFGYEPFSVPRLNQRVLYLIPESSLGPFWSRIQLFRLEEYVRTDRLLVRTLSSREQVSLDDPRLLKAAAGADVFLDTAVRFMDGSENDVESARPFADTLFRLLNAGARSITGAHHAPKGFEGQDCMTLENSFAEVATSERCSAPVGECVRLTRHEINSTCRTSNRGTFSRACHSFSKADRTSTTPGISS
jgi:hypothetical protein